MMTAPLVRRARAGQHVHERRLAGPVVADQPDALAAPDGEINAVERANGAELYFDALQIDDCGTFLSHRPPSWASADDRGRAQSPRSLHVGFDGRDRIVLRVFVAGDAALFDLG